MSRIAFVALIALLGAASVCRAQPVLADGAPKPKVVWKHDAALLRQQWAHTSEGKLVYGSVDLDCAVGGGGAASDCKVIEAKPADPRLTEAALRAAALYKAVGSPVGIRGKIEMDVTFDKPPEWLKRPDINELIAAYPRAAGEKGISGQASITCKVSTDGLLRDCTVTSEAPAGLGFGQAALILSRSFLMKPAIREGQPVEAAEVTIPIGFKLNGPITGGERTTIIGTTVWAQTPSIPDILDAIDKKVGDRFADGKVVFQCDVNRKTGRLSGCDVLNTSPGMVQFTGVARSLTPKFQIQPQALATIKDRARINLAFSFPDMSSPAWGRRSLDRPQWIRTLRTDATLAIFPNEAAKAGLKTGAATVDCVVGADGGLTQCETVSESTPGVGFGEVAQKIAETFATNPWTEDGLPAQGSHVRMPIRMNDSTAEAKDPPPDAAPATPQP